MKLTKLEEQVLRGIASDTIKTWFDIELRQHTRTVNRLIEKQACHGNYRWGRWGWREAPQLTITPAGRAALAELDKAKEGQHGN